jgi:hypothetical protein
MVRPCQRISTSISAEQASSSGAMRRTWAVSPLLSGETTLAGSDASGLKGKPQPVLQVVIPPQRPFFGSARVDDGFVVDPIFPNRVFLKLPHCLAARTAHVGTPEMQRCFPAIFE